MHFAVGERCCFCSSAKDRVSTLSVHRGSSKAVCVVRCDQAIGRCTDVLLRLTSAITTWRPCACCPQVDFASSTLLFPPSRPLEGGAVAGARFIHCQPNAVLAIEVHKQSGRRCPVWHASHEYEQRSLTICGNCACGVARRVADGAAGCRR